MRGGEARRVEGKGESVGTVILDSAIFEKVFSYFYVMRGDSTSSHER